MGRFKILNVRYMADRDKFALVTGNRSIWLIAFLVVKMQLSKKVRYEFETIIIFVNTSNLDAFVICIQTPNILTCIDCL